LNSDVEKRREEREEASRKLITGSDIRTEKLCEKDIYAMY